MAHRIDELGMQPVANQRAVVVAARQPGSPFLVAGSLESPFFSACVAGAGRRHDYTSTPSCVQHHLHKQDHQQPFVSSAAHHQTMSPSQVQTACPSKHASGQDAGKIDQDAQACVAAIGTLVPRGFPAITKQDVIAAWEAADDSTKEAGSKKLGEAVNAFDTKIEAAKSGCQATL